MVVNAEMDERILPAQVGEVRQAA